MIIISRSDSRCFGHSAFILISLVLALALPYRLSVAQQPQTARLSVEVVTKSAPELFLDSLTTVMERWSQSGDSLMASRHPGGKELTLPKLRKDLFYKTGWDLTDSNRALLSYRFNLVKGAFEEEITSFQFLHRSWGADKVDMLLYLSLSEKEWIRKLLQKKSGLSSGRTAVKPFYQELSFLHLLETTDSEIIRIGGKVTTEEEKRKLISRIRQTAGLSQ